MKYRIYLFITVIILSACSHKKDVQVERFANVKYVSITDSIYSYLPGRFFYQNKKIYWEDPMGSINFMHMIDAVTGKELYRFANKGEGPDEFTIYFPSMLPQGGMCIRNRGRHMAILYKPSADTLKATKVSFFGNGNYTSATVINDTSIVYLYPMEPLPFRFQRKNHSIRFGHWPVDEMVTNGDVYYQGDLLYNKDRKVLIYNTRCLPYMAIYDMSNDKFKLLKELKTPFDYRRDRGELRVSRSTAFGAIQISMTKDYIVALQCDKLNEEEVTIDSEPKDPYRMPHAVFVYDYDLNLVKIYNFPFKLLRIAGDLKSNDVYLIAMKPEYEIIKFKI